MDRVRFRGRDMVVPGSTKYVHPGVLFFFLKKKKSQSHRK